MSTEKKPIDDGGPAFPGDREAMEGSAIVRVPVSGMSLLDHFAGQALAGMLAYSHVNPKHGNYHENCSPVLAAQVAYNYGRAMLTEKTRRLANLDDPLEALERLVEVIDAAGLQHLSNGVQLGQTVWFVKANGAMDWARSVIAKARGR